MSLLAGIRVFLLPVLVLAMQSMVAWLFLGTASAAWDSPDATLSAEAAATRTLLLFAAAGPVAMVLLAWGFHTLYSRRRIASAVATSFLYLPPLLVSGILTWTLLALKGWI